MCVDGGMTEVAEASGKEKGGTGLDVLSSGDLWGVR